MTVTLDATNESRVETDTELTDDVNVLVLVFGLEIHAAGAGDGAQVLFQLFLGHADTVIADRQGAGILVGGDVDGQILFLDADGGIGQALEVELVAGIGRVGDQFAQEDLAIGVDGVDHQVEQLFAFGFELTHCHNQNSLFYKI